jgi:hypothetical protein
MYSIEVGMSQTLNNKTKKIIFKFKKIISTFTPRGTGAGEASTKRARRISLLV